MKQKNNLLFWGLVNMLAPLPLFIVSTLLCWFLFFGVGFYVWGYENMPEWAKNLSMLPVYLLTLLHIGSSIWAIVAGAKRRGTRHAVMCIVTSTIGILSQGIMWFLMIYIGSRF